MRAKDLRACVKDLHALEAIDESSQIKRELPFGAVIKKETENYIHNFLKREASFALLAWLPAMFLSGNFFHWFFFFFFLIDAS